MEGLQICLFSIEITSVENVDLGWCLMGQVYLSGPKSKLGLPRVTMGLDKSFNQSPQGGLEKIGYTSSNGPLVNCCKVPEQIPNRTCAKRTKWRVYSPFEVSQNLSHDFHVLFIRRMHILVYDTNYEAISSLVWEK